MMSMMVPLFDTSMPSLWEMKYNRVLAVNGTKSDRRCSLGVPDYVSDDDAIKVAQERGWLVLGIWRRKL